MKPIDDIGNDADINDVRLSLARFSKETGIDVSTFFEEEMERIKADAATFFRRLQIMSVLDLTELQDAGVVETEFVGGSDWTNWHKHFLDYVDDLDQTQKDALWRLVETRRLGHD